MEPTPRKSSPLKEVDKIARWKRRWEHRQKRVKADMVLIPYIAVTPEVKSLFCQIAEQKGVSITGLFNQVLAYYLGYRGPMPDYWLSTGAWSPKRSLSLRVPRKLRDQLKVAAAKRRTSITQLAGAIVAHYVQAQLGKKEEEAEG